jgi:hypothetical protein
MPVTKILDIGTTLPSARDASPCSPKVPSAIVLAAKLPSACAVARRRRPMGTVGSFTIEGDREVTYWAVSRSSTGTGHVAMRLKQAADKGVMR